MSAPELEANLFYFTDAMLKSNNCYIFFYRCHTGTSIDRGRFNEFSPERTGEDQTG